MNSTLRWNLLLGCVVLAAEQTLKARQQWRDVRAEQTGLHFFEEVLHHE